MIFFQSELRQCDRQQIASGFIILESKGPFPHHKKLGDFSIVSDLEYPWVSHGFLSYFLRVNDIQSKGFLETSISNRFSKSTYCEIDLEVYREKLLINHR